MDMKKLLVLLAVAFLGRSSSAQNVDSIYFHLYTDSLKKGFYNYINVDGKCSNGSWLPLSSKEVVFSTEADSALRFQNNDLFIDSSYKGDVVRVKAVLRSNPAVWREVIIYIRKRGFDEPLLTNEEILNEYRKPVKKKN